MLAASRLRQRGQAWLEHLACSRLAVAVPPVSVWPAVSRWAGMASAGSPLSGVAVQVWGGSVIFGVLACGT
jgi:hypothetical protein